MNKNCEILKSNACGKKIVLKKKLDKKYLQTTDVANADVIRNRMRDHS